MFTGSHADQDPPIEWDILVYGSVANGLCQNLDSDLDLTLVTAEFGVRHDVLLRRIKLILQKEARFCVSQEPMHIQSGFLLSLTDEKYGIEVDISVNKVLEIMNSKLIHAYSSFDERFLKLALYLKQWNKENFPNRQKRLNSFSVILMLIAFLQHRKVLPNLQALATEHRMTRFELQTRELSYVGEADTGFVEPHQFAIVIDLPMFLDNPAVSMIKQAGLEQGAARTADQS